jgi:OOP family OmpA-OmpF porin
MIMIKTRPKSISSAFIAVSFLVLSACGRNQPAPEETPEPAASPTKPVSIFRPAAEIVPIEAPLAQLDAAVSFGQGGNELDDAAKAQLATIIKSPQMKAGGTVTLRGHTDSTGDDEANLRVSLQRAQAVETYLIENGVDPDRIKIIALGEMRPAAPNARLDGTPDEEGRAANRRVDVTIAVPGTPDAAAASTGDEPQPTPSAATLVEAIAAPD